ncbi:MAG TPA: type II toxin-antitoxin system RelE/ParE family toxin, partial [Ignavibacteria bacterium]|nr:type II toxin-antitoxin system RelE/ParE family toxin [Ignavibacteria bacterium]
MYKSIILPLAKEDIREAAKWYNKQQNGLGKRFTAEVREKVHFIRQNPKASNI